MLMMPQQTFALRPMAEKYNMSVFLEGSEDSGSNVKSISFADNEVDIKKALVKIKRLNKPIEEFKETDRGKIYGLGFIIGEDHSHIYVSTAQHIIRYLYVDNRAEVTLSNNRTVNAQIISPPTRFTYLTFMLEPFMAGGFAGIKQDRAVLAISKDSLDIEDFKHICILRMLRENILKLIGKNFTIWSVYGNRIESRRKLTFSKKVLELKIPYIKHGKYVEIEGVSGSPIVAYLNRRPYFVGMAVGGVGSEPSDTAKKRYHRNQDVFGIGLKFIKKHLQDIGLAGLLETEVMLDKDAISIPEFQIQNALDSAA